VADAASFASRRRHRDVFDQRPPITLPSRPAAARSLRSP
jgi:hypothetical protein